MSLSSVVDTVVLAGGAPLGPTALATADRLLAAARFVVAADGGVQHALRLGRPVDVLVGDLDSIAPGELVQVRAAGTAIIAHPVDKDATDLELALDLVLDRDGGPDVTVIGGHGGRPDHLLGNALLFAAERYRELRLRAVWDGAHLHVVRDSMGLAGSPGDLVSLLAVHGPADGVTTTGLRFALTDARLEPGSSLGMSNRLTAPTATVEVRTGVLLAVLAADDQNDLPTRPRPPKGS